MLIIQKKSFYEKYDTEIKIPPLMNLQIWDNDSFSPDDFLGTICLNLSHFVKPFESAEKCVIKKSREYSNLFAKKSVRGWFPVYGKQDGGKMGQTVIKHIILNNNHFKYIFNFRGK